MELEGPGRWIFDPLLGREPQDLLHLRAHVEHLADAVVLTGDGFEVDDRRKVLDDPLETSLPLLSLLLARLLCRDLDHQATDHRRRPFVVLHRVPDVADPHPRAVPREEPVFLIEGAAGGGDADEPADHAVVVVGMEVVVPEPGVVQPIGHVVTEDLLDTLGDGCKRHRGRVCLPGDPVEIGQQALDSEKFGVGRVHRGMPHRLLPKSDSHRTRAATTRTA